MKKTIIAFSLIGFLASPFLNQQVFAEAQVELLYGAKVNVPEDWNDLGSALDLKANTASMAKSMKEIGSAETPPKLPLINLASKTGNPPAMITILLKECPDGGCPDSKYFEHLINNPDETKKNEKTEQDNADKANAESGHKTIRHFPAEIRRECNAYSIAGGQEVSMYKQIDYVSKVKVIYTDKRILGISIGYPSADKKSGEAAEKSYASFGCK